MADSFVFRAAAQPVPAPPMQKRKVLVTGASGNIGSYFCEHAYERYELTMSLAPGQDAGELARYGRAVTADLADLPAVGEACKGIDTVVHLAAAASPDTPWDTLLPANIEGTYNLFVAAKAASCRRVIYASSIHAVSGYPAGRQVQADDPVNPGDLYGVTKCFGEAMARYMAQQQGLSSIVIRIGAFQPREAARRPEGISIFDAFVSRRDLTHLIELCIDDESLQFAIVHGLSNNAFNRMDISEARELLGYEPLDDFAREHPELKHLNLAEQVSPHSEQGHQQQPGIREELEEVRTSG